MPQPCRVISPMVLFRKHTDLSVFGSAAAISHEFSDTLNGVGSGRAVFNGEDLQGVKWLHNVLGTDENAFVWNRPTVVTVQDGLARRFSWVVEGIECSRSDNVWAGTITLSGRGIGSPSLVAAGFVAAVR